MKKQCILSFNLDDLTFSGHECLYVVERHLYQMLFVWSIMHFVTDLMSRSESLTTPPFYKQNSNCTADVTVSNIGENSILCQFPIKYKNKHTWAVCLFKIIENRRTNRKCLLFSFIFQYNRLSFLFLHHHNT